MGSGDHYGLRPGWILYVLISSQEQMQVQVKVKVKMARNVIHMMKKYATVWKSTLRSVMCNVRNGHKSILREEAEI